MSTLLSSAAVTADLSSAVVNSGAIGVSVAVVRCSNSGSSPVPRPYFGPVQQCNLVTPLQLYFTYRSAFEYGQFWRVLTTFLYWGNLSLDFFFHLFFL